MNKYKITCLKCKQSDDILINDSDHQIINFGRGAGTNFLAGRWRGDSSWGWECICGNDNRVSKSEEKFVNELVNGTEQQIKDIVKSLKIDDKKQFVMIKI